MYVRVNVWQGSIEEGGVLLFDTFEAAKNDLAEEVETLIQDVGLCETHALEFYEAISDAERPGFIYRNEAAQCSYFILECSWGHNPHEFD